MKILILYSILFFLSIDSVNAKTVRAKVLKVSSSKLILMVNIGHRSGLKVSSKIKLLYKGKKIGKGKVKRVSKRKSIIELKKTDLPVGRLRGRYVELKFGSDKKKKKKNSNKDSFKIRGNVEVERHSNVFKLSDDNLARLAENDPDNIVSGRYNGISGASDTLVVPALKFMWEKGDTEVELELKYNKFLGSTAGSYFEGELEIAHSLGKGSQLEFGAKLEFDRFDGNKLSGSVDKNNNMNISKDERIYSAASYSELEFSAGYRVRLHKSGEQKLYLTPFLTSKIRKYNATFGNRDRLSYGGGVKTKFRANKSFSLSLSYQYALQNSSSNDGVLLLDETATGFARDLNGDGIQAENGHVETKLDRSATINTIKGGMEFRATKSISLKIKGELEKKSYKTDNELDLDRYNRTISETTIGGELKWKINKKMSTSFKYEVESGEDYKNNVIGVLFNWRPF